ncbi:serine/threonine-protein kinase [Nonomuraea sp. NPDC004580]|uniref:serine/threonine-protein kinase n=1 Tax=Nonomuraea sp. NPDC004580 TaxID=3154552 RepID=UPI00339E73B3
MPQAEPLREGDPPAVGPYRLLGRLGSGGQGVVYLGQRPGSALVAIKVFRDGGGGDRFVKEVEAARRVEPFCIAQVLDASAGDRPYIVTEYVEGPSLQQAGRHHGADLQRLAVATATALAAIHQAGIVHRDFKPANVLLGPGGPRVIDFGIARSATAGPSGTSGIMGTPAYMAPEQLAGAPVGPAADVFAWGSVMVFAAAGGPPFGEDTLPAVINRILHHEPRLGDLTEPLRTVVMHCLAKDPARRPTMQDVLLRLLGSGPQHPSFHAAGGPQAAARGMGHGRPGPSEAGYVLGGPGPGEAGYGGPGTGDAGYGFGGPGQGGFSHGGARSGAPTAPGRAAASGGASRTWLVAGVASAVTLVVTGGVAWGVTSIWGDDQRSPTTQALATTTTKTPAPVTTTGKRSKRTTSPSPSKSKRRTTPPPAQRTTRPATPATPATRQPTRTPATRTTKATTKPTKRASSGAGTLRIASLVAQGARKANTQDCQVGQSNTFAVVEGSKLHTRFDYQWILDGKVVSGSSAYISDIHTQHLSGPLVDVGSHTVTLRLTSPSRISRSLSFRVCPTGTE